MKKILLGLVVLLGLTLGLGMVEVNASEPSVGQSFSYSFRFNSNGVQGAPSTLTANYGDLVTIDDGTLSQESTYVGFIDQGKVHPVLNTATSIRLTERTNIEIFYKDNGNSAVIFMDSNKNFLDIAYTQGNGMLLEGDIVDYTTLSKPGLNVTGWNIQNIGSHVFNADTIVYPIYNNALGSKTLTVEGGTGAGTYNFDQYVTVVADIEGFDYWLKDGVLASLDPEYTFTMAADHHLVAVYNDDTFTPNLGSFVTVSDIIPINNDFVAIMGQFDLAFSEEIVEWGIIKSDNYAGAITFNTPDAEVIYSKNYNADTNEFVLFFAAAETYPNFRAFVTTYNTMTETVSTSYSYLQEEEVVSMYASDLIISEYGEGSSNNKWIEIYNGTGSAVSLSEYSVKIFVNGAVSASTTISLPIDVSLNHGDVFVVANSSANATILSSADLISGSLSHNGNDPVGLFFETNLIDIVGIPGDSSDHIKDTTYVRKASIVEPNSIWNTDEWDTYASDATTYLGSHTMNLPTFTRQFTGLISAPDQLHLSEASSLSEIFVDQSATISLSYPNGGLEGVHWVSDNASVFTFNSTTGEVVGVAPGTGTIYAYSYYNHNVVAEYTITVNEIQVYDVTFVYNDGATSDLVEEVNGGETVSAPVEPRRTGYGFGGWYTDNGTFVTLYDFNAIVTENISVYAKWIEEFTVAFDSNGGSAVASQSVLDGGLADEPTAPTKEGGFVFSGWFIDNTTFENEFIFESDAITSDITLYAKWVDASVEVETIVYETGFESAEGFTATTSYNNTTVSYSGPDGEQWGRYYGTPSTTGAITGSQSMQMRYYTTASNNHGYVFTNFDINKVTKVTFKALNTSGNNVTVSISIDGGQTYIEAQTFTLGTSSSDYTYFIPELYQNQNIRIKFTLVPGTTNASRVTIDDVVVYGMRNPS